MNNRAWNKESAGAGKWTIRLENGLRVPGMIIGGKRRWLIDEGGRLWPKVFKSAEAAGYALVRHTRRESLPLRNRIEYS